MTQVREGVPLAPLTTLGIGGPAARLVTATSEADLVDAVLTSPAPVLVLGGGSNLVVPDAGLPGTVVQVATRGVEVDGGTVRVAAGEDWEALVGRCVADGLSGVEALSGIPGLTGATPVQNVGAYGQEVADVVTCVRVLDRRTAEVVELPASDCGFSYRGSRFKAEPDRWVVLAVTFALEVSALSAPVGYAELALALGVDVGDRAPLADVRREVLRLRRSKGMVVDPNDPDSRSAGSFFTNPVLSDAQLQALRRRLPEGVDPPSWPDGGGTKLSAAWLISQAGFGKGHFTGAVGLSTKHVLAVVNRGGGTAAELVAVAREVRDRVRDAFGVELVHEPVLAGGLSL